MLVTNALIMAGDRLKIRKILIVNRINMVEAAGVEPDIGTENTQVTDTENA